MRKVNLEQAFERLGEAWSPKIAGEINDSYVKLAKLRGEFVWHHHQREDELFLVVAGVLRMRWKDEAGLEREEVVRPGEFIIVRHGVEHLPCADPEANGGECHIVLLEPKSTLNTGNLQNERTVETLEWI